MKILGVIATLGVGAGLAYLFDPDQGRRRRALLRDKTVAVTSSMEKELEGTLRHWSNRARGVVAQARGAVRTSG